MRSTFAVFAFLVTLPVAAGCGSSAASVDLGSASVIPAGAPAYVWVNTDQSSAQWKAADELSARFPDRQKQIDSLEREMKKQAGIDYKADLEPALGTELALVWLDFEDNGNNFVALLQPSDEDAFKRVVTKGNAKDPKNKVLYEKVGDWEVLSDKQAVLDRFSKESTAGGAVLADDPTFQKAMESISDDALVRGYVNGAKAMEAIRKQVSQGDRKTVDDAGKLDWAVFGVGASTEGVRYDTVLHGTPGKLVRGAGGGGGTPRFDAALPDSVPGNTLLYFTFHGSKNMFDGVAKTPQLATADLRPFVKLLRKVGTLLQGENAIYVRNPPAGSKIPEITIVADPGSGIDGARTLSGILSEKAFDLGSELKPATIGGVTATKIDVGGGVEIDYANIANKLVVTDGPGGIKAFASPASKLADDANFTDATNGSGLPAKSEGFLYVNVTGGVALAERLADTPIPARIKRNLKPLRSAVEYAVSRPSEIQITFFLKIN